MQTQDQNVIRVALLNELRRMKELGFLIVDDAFEVAQTLDLDACGNLPLTAVAFLASERGFAQFKSRQRLEAVH